MQCPEWSYQMLTQDTHARNFLHTAKKHDHEILQLFSSDSLHLPSQLQVEPLDSLQHPGNTPKLGQRQRCRRVFSHLFEALVLLWPSQTKHFRGRLSRSPLWDASGLAKSWTMELHPPALSGRAALSLGRSDVHAFCQVRRWPE